MTDQLLPAFPSLTPSQALAALSELIHQPPSSLAAVASTELDGASFYPLANSRIDSADLARLRGTVLEVAIAHGYPKSQSPTARRAFDQALGVVLHQSMRLIRAEAADDGIWSFLSLRLCPDVAFWRYPGERGEEVSSAEIDRFLGGVRHVFGRLWWRVEVLTAEVSSQLLEDEAVGLMERPTIGGYPPLAQYVAKKQLEYVGRLGGEKRQDMFRDALKRLRREMGFVSVYMLEEPDISELVDTLFETAAEAITSTPRAGRLPLPIEEFRSGCLEYWSQVEPLLGVPRWGEVLVLRQQAASYLADDPEKSSQATRLAVELSGLLDHWHDLGAEERSIVVASLRYFLLEDDSLPDAAESGLNDDEIVVSAAFAALHLERASSAV